MFMSIVIGLTLAAHSACPQPRPEHPLVQKLRLQALERSLLEDLRTTKDAEEFLGDNIKLFESLLKNRVLSPSGESSTQYRLIRFRERMKYLANKRKLLEAWFEQRRLHPDSTPDLEVYDRLERLMKEWDAWEEVWESGRIAPMPREVKAKRKP